MEQSSRLGSATWIEDGKKQHRHGPWEAENLPKPQEFLGLCFVQFSHALRAVVPYDVFN